MDMGAVPTVWTVNVSGTSKSLIAVGGHANTRAQYLAWAGRHTGNRNGNGSGSAFQFRSCNVDPMGTGGGMGVYRAFFRGFDAQVGLQRLADRSL